MTYQEIINRVSEENNIPKEIVDKAYKGYWSFIKTFIEDLPLKENLSEEDFSKLRTNFNIPSLGKLTCTYDRYKRVKDKFKYIQNLRKRNEKAD